MIILIYSIADMLLKLKEEEENKISKFSEEFPHSLHRTIIGDMYEGLTKKLLEKTIFKELNLKITSGQIINKKGDFSTEIDCMIVVGDGVPIPNTEKHIYDISDVIAVIEVKKNLNKSDLIDSYLKMAKLTQMFDPRDMSESEYRLFRDAFISVVGIEVPPHDKISEFKLEIQMIYHTLLVETLMPLRIVFGFYGYRSMKSLREGFIKLLEENISIEDETIKGFSPISFPNQIFTYNSSLVKTNGMPYVGPLERNDFWQIYVSSNHNPLLHLLELLWTKLSYKYQISSELFGEELTMEVLYRYLGAKAIKQGELVGWEFLYTELPSDIGDSPLFYEWEPTELTREEFILINMLCNGNSINTSSEIFINLLEQNGNNEDSFLKRLNDKRLIFKARNGDLSLLTDECIAGIKDGKFYAGENKDGKMRRWLLN